MARDKRPRGWWARNWKWAVPVGCFGGLALMAGFVFLIMTFVYGLMKSSDVYKEALERARGNPAVVEALGAPIEEGFFTTGNINVSNGSGDADLVIPIAGPKGEAKIHAIATKRAGKWTYSTLEVEVESTGERIPLTGD